MRKNICLLLVLFMLTGCSVTYDLDLDESMKESITAVDNYNSSHSVLYDVYSTKPIPLSKNNSILDESDDKLAGVSYYLVNDVSDENNFGLSFSGNFNNDIELKDSYMLYFGVGNFNYSTEENKIFIRIPSGIKLFEQYPDLSLIKVNIKTKYKVIQSNADEVNDNVYTWIITRNNYKNKAININVNTSNKPEISDDSMIRFAIVLVSIVVICTVIYFFIKWRFEKNNSL